MSGHTTNNARFLRGLPNYGFAPPPADVAAVGVPSLPQTADAQAAAFAAEVAAFAGDYWSLEPPIRRKRWQALADRAVGPAGAWLAELEAGLGVVPVPQPDTLAKEVAGLVWELVALPPAARAARRLAWLTAPGRRDPGWVAAARTVLRTDLPLARLDPRLFDWYSLNLVPRPVPPDPNAPPPLDIDRFREPAVSPAQLAPMEAPVARVGCGSWWVVMVVVVGILRLLISTGGRQPAPPPPPAYQQPVQPPAPAWPRTTPDAPFTAEEVQQYQDYERAVAARGGKAVVAPPGRYARWVALGRPDLRYPP